MPDTTIVSVVLTAPPFAIYSYGVPDHFAADDFPVGLRVLVPMAGGLRVGVVWAVGGEAPAGVTVRPVLWPLDRTPLCDPAYLDLVRNLASRHLAPPGRILGALLPRGPAHRPADLPP